jgi:hypothetical protein
MGLRRKDSRRITVAGQTFRWLLTRREVGSERMLFWPRCLYVERAEGAGQRLVVRFDYPVWHQVAGQVEYPTPELVRRMIEAALAAGWQPALTGLPDLELDGQAFLPHAQRSSFG